MVKPATIVAIKPAKDLSVTSNGCTTYEPLVASYTDWDVRTVLAIMKAESGCHAEHINNTPATGDYSVGLMQINLYGALAASRPSAAWLVDPGHNIAFAHALWLRDGYWPWTTWVQGIYKRYL